MGQGAISRFDHFEERLLRLVHSIAVAPELEETYMCVRGPSFQLDGEGCKEEYLYCCSTRVPKRTRYTCAEFSWAILTIQTA